MNKLFLLLSVLLYITLPFTNAQEYKSYIKLRNGQTIFGKVEYKSPFLGTPYILMDDSKEYSFDDILLYQNEEGYFRRVDSTDNYFAERIVEGKIDLYKKTFDFYSPGYVMSTPGPGGMSISTFGGGYSYSIEFDYFSKNNGDLLEASYGNLLEALADNNESISHLKTYNTLRYVTYGLIGSGVALLIAGLATSTKEKPNFGLMIVGGVVGLSSWIPHLIGKDEYNQAIEVYNR